MKLDILAIAAHPDDVELCCAGTLASMIRSGKKAGVLDLTQGEMGTRGTPSLRLKEAEKAAGILGLSERCNAGLPDCGLENSEAHRKIIISHVRRWQPEICLINALEDRHPDHVNAARLTLDALFYSGLAKLETLDDSGRPQQPWRPRHILHFMQHWPFKPTLVFDITDTLKIKEEAIRAFSSQFYTGPGDRSAADEQTMAGEPETYVSSEQFFLALRGRAREYGQQAGFVFGEPFLYYGGPIPAKNMDFLLATRPVR